MVAFIILIITTLPGVIVCWLWRPDWDTIEKENERFYNEDGNHIYYDRKLIAQLDEEKQN